MGVDPLLRSQLWPDPKAGPWRLTFSFRPDDGAWWCTDLAISYIGWEEGGPAQVTSTLLRQIPLASQMRMAEEHLLRIAATVSKNSTTESLAAFSEQLVNKHRGKGGRPVTVTPARLGEVATVYRAAVQKGEPPTSAVATHFGINRSTASNYVYRSRQLGLLPPSTRRKTSPKEGSPS